MSEMVFEQVKQLSGNLSIAEKAQMIEWLSVALQQELTTVGFATVDAAHPADQSNGAVAYQNGAHISAAETAEAPAGTSSAERAWTAEEIRELMRPEPKTGAEIVAMLDQLNLSEWQELDIPDAVEWLHEQRRTQTQKRIQQWNNLE